MPPFCLPRDAPFHAEAEWLQHALPHATTAQLRGREAPIEQDLLHGARELLQYGRWKLDRLADHGARRVDDEVDVEIRFDAAVGHSAGVARLGVARQGR